MPLDQETIKAMVEIELQQLAMRIHQEHGVDVTVALHMFHPGGEGSFLSSFQSAVLENSLLNPVFLALGIFSMLRQAGIPDEVIDMAISCYGEQGEGIFSKLQQALNA